ncbi:hypothetical protein D3C85_1505730 [compost metagenome]
MASPLHFTSLILLGVTTIGVTAFTLRVSVSKHPFSSTTLKVYVIFGSKFANIPSVFVVT